MARAILLSGSYMLYDRHKAAPPPEVFAEIKYDVPNISGRMDNLRAAVLRPQIALLPERAAAWNARYARLEQGLRGTPGLTLIDRPALESMVASSFQALLLDWPAPAIEAALARCKVRGVELKWFGAPEPAGFTSTYRHWHYAHPGSMPATDRILAGLVDMRLPLTFSLADCDQIASILRAEIGAAWQAL